MTQHPIAITGMHRSGTSMITRGLHESGLSLLGGDDRLIDAADDNPEGFWENKHIVECNDALLEAAGGSWDNPPDLLPQAIDDPRLTDLADRATEALAGLRRHDHWGFKDPRTCLTASYWLDLQSDLRFIVCVRHPLEVALSLRRRNQNSYSLGLALWERYYTAVLDAVPPDRRIITHFDTYFVDPEAEFARLCDFVGLDFAGTPVRPDLRHHTIGVSLSEAGVSTQVVRLYHDLCHQAGSPVPPETPADQGQVRRLILDGSVATRHAEQRQEAIDRLAEREQGFRDEIDALHRDKTAALTELRNRIYMLEGELTAVRDSTVRALIDAQLRPLAEAAAATQATIAEIEIRLRSPTQRGRVKLLVAAKAVARRLPPPAQRTLRQGRAKLYRRRHRSTGAESSPPVATDAAEPDPAPRWSAERFVDMAGTTGDGERWLVITEGSPDDLAGRLGDDPRRLPPSDDAPSGDISAIAVIEAARYRGVTRLAVPAVARPWLGHRDGLPRHIHRYPVIAEDPDLGFVAALDGPIDRHDDTLTAQLGQLASQVDSLDAIVDWTHRGITADLAEHAVARQPADRHPLPYLDDSIHIVVVDRDGDRKEAARVASLAVVVVAEDEHGVAEVHTIETQADLSTGPGARILVVAGADGDSRWLDQLSTEGQGTRTTLLTAPLDDASLSEIVDPDAHDVIVLLEPQVLPLPATLAATARAVAAAPDQAATGKVLAPDGRLESAGGIVFGDASVALIGEGSSDVSAPWHEFVRSVCWPAGVMAVSSDLWQSSTRPPHLTGRAFLREWAASLWADGRGVRYDPAIVTVRLSGHGGEPSTPLSETAWARVLDLRPSRPTDLHDGSWRWVMGHDDVDGCRG